MKTRHMIALMAAFLVAFVVLFSTERADFNNSVSINMNQTGLLVLPSSSSFNAGIIHDPHKSILDELHQLAQAKISRTSAGKFPKNQANAVNVTFPDKNKTETVNRIFLRHNAPETDSGSNHDSHFRKTSEPIIRGSTSESLVHITTTTGRRTMQMTSGASQSSTVQNETEVITATVIQRKNNVLITVCTVVLNETAYIVEWIEFMRLQGVERIVIYDDGSSDNISMIPEFYTQNDPTVEVIVLPAVFSGPIKTGWDYVDQKRNLQHCLDTYGDSTEWMLVCDVDEFIYSPTYGSLRNVTVRADEMGVERNMTISTIYFPCARFGTGGQKWRFHYALSRTSSGEIVYTNGCGVELIVDHIYRGRWNTREDDGGPAPAYCEKPPHLDLHCYHGFGKSMFRARDVLAPDVHIPAWFREDVEDKSTYTTHDLGACNHYYIRSREDAGKKARDYASKYAPGMILAYFNATDEAFYGRFDPLHVTRGMARIIVTRACRDSREDRPPLSLKTALHAFRATQARPEQCFARSPQTRSRSIAVTRPETVTARALTVSGLLLTVNRQA